MNLKELSQILDLSQTTVSRALNGYPEVNEGTRRRVMEAARRYGYTPNAAARRLATGKANAIGCVLRTDGEGMSPQFMEFLAGVSEQAAKIGQDVVLASAEKSGEDAAYRRLASHGQVDGVILFAPDRSGASAAATWTPPYRLAERTSDHGRVETSGERRAPGDGRGGTRLARPTRRPRRGDRAIRL